MVPDTNGHGASTSLRLKTRDVVVPDELDADGRPFTVTIRRLPAGETYLYWEDEQAAKAAGMRATWRRWAQQAIVAPQFNFNGIGPADGIDWDALPLSVHAALGAAIAKFSFELPAGVRDTEAAFRGGQPAGDAAGGAGGGPGSDGGVAPAVAPAPVAAGAGPAAGGGAGV